MAGDHDENGDAPSTIRSLAVSAEDVVDAFVYTRENPGTAVLRVTPPFHGRMRARLHVYRVDDAQVTGAIHVRPVDLLADEVVDAYPAFEERHDDRLESPSEAETGPDAGARTESNSKRHDSHADALESWRERAREAIVDSVTLETDAGTTRIDVASIG